MFYETQSLLEGPNAEIQATVPTYGGANLSQATLMANVGTTLATPIVVHVASDEGEGTGVSNVSVRLSNAQTSPALTCFPQGGYADPGSILTNSQGDAYCYVEFTGSGTGTYNVVVGAGAISGSSTSVEALETFGPFTFTSIPGAPAAVRIISGNNQVGDIAQTLNPLVAELVDANGNAVQGQAMVWSVSPAIAATISGTQTVTDNNGLVSVYAALNASATGAVQVIAALKSNPSISATFLLSPVGAVTSLLKVSGDQQTAAAGTNFSNPLVVQLANAAGAVANYPVQFAGAGVSVANSVVSTNTSGQASVIVKAGTTVGPATVTAMAAQYELTFNLYVTSPSLLPTAVAAVSGNNQSATEGSAFAAPLVVQVSSQAGPLANIPVTFFATGPVTLSALTVTTNSNGQAQITVQAGSIAGVATVTAAVGAGSSTFSFTFNLTVLPQPPSSAVAIFGTGHLAGKSDLAPVGSVDGNFTLISCPSAACASNGSGAYNPYVTLTGQYPFPTWLANTGTAQWIGPARGGNEMSVDSPGQYVYRQTFDLTGFNLSTVVLNGSFAIDDQLGYIQLNGATVGPSSTSFSTLTPFTISSGFVQGENTIDFYVSNGPTGGIYNPTGLIAELSGAGVLAATGPPPAITAGGIVQWTARSRQSSPASGCRYSGAIWQAPRPPGRAISRPLLAGRK